MRKRYTHIIIALLFFSIKCWAQLDIGMQNSQPVVPSWENYELMQYGKIGAKATFFSSMTNPTTRFVNGLIYAAVGLLGALGAMGHSAFVGADRFVASQMNTILRYSFKEPFIVQQCTGDSNI